MSQEQIDVQAAVAQLKQTMRDAITTAQSGDVSTVETQRQIACVEQRLDEAAMLLSLATGTNQPVTLHVQPVLRAALEADKAARRVLNTDIDITKLSLEEQARAVESMELAESAYTQWRALSALSMLHLSNVFRLVEQRNVDGE